MYYFCFYLEGKKKKKRINCLFSILCIQLVTEHAFEIPDNIRPGHLIKELSKVIRSVEVRTEATLKSAGKIFESGHSIVAMHSFDLIHSLFKVNIYWYLIYFLIKKMRKINFSFSSWRSRGNCWKYNAFGVWDKENV